MNNHLSQLHNMAKDTMFFEKGHKYVTEDGEVYTSVTTLTSKFKPKFKKDYWLMYKALQASGIDVRSEKSKYGKVDHILYNNIWYHYTDSVLMGLLKVTPQDIELEWEAKATKGKERGTYTHLVLENLFMGKSFDSLSEHKELEEAAKNFYQDYKDILIPVRLEALVRDHDFKLAGQVDGIFLWEGKYVIIDYKTDKKLEKSNYFSRFKEPLANLDDCNYNKYCLQLSLYKYIVEKNSDIKIDKLYIVWLKPEGKYDLVPITYKENEVKKMLNIHTQNR